MSRTGLPRRRLSALVLVALCAGAVAFAQPPARTLLPVDEAASMPDFFSFRAQLQSAIARRDVAALMAVVDEQIKNGFGGDDGKAAFEREWRPAASDSKVWEVLATVLALGGSRGGDGTFTAPYVFSAWPDGADGFEHVAVVASRVRIRSAPRADAPEVGQASFEILPRARVHPEPPEEWTAVAVPKGGTGYIHSRYVRSPIDYRASFTKKDGQWRMVMLLAGD